MVKNIWNSANVNKKRIKKRLIRKENKSNVIIIIRFNTNRCITTLWFKMGRYDIRIIKMEIKKVTFRWIY